MVWLSIPDQLSFKMCHFITYYCKQACVQYIDFSVLQTSESVTRFIATQGPLPQTSEDFWEMIVQYRCPAIIMLTGLVDENNVSYLIFLNS